MLLKSLIFSVICLPYFADANTSDDFYEIEVTVTDRATREPLIGVNVFTDDKSTFTGITDFDGKVVLKAPKGKVLNHREMINFSYIGYQTVKYPLFQIRTLGGIIKMDSDVTLEEVVVVGRRDAPLEEIPFLVDKISNEEIFFTNSQTAADALSNNGDVYVQKSQMGGGSPVIRGFEANKVLLVLDGVRLNNAIYRNGHLQNAITIDNAILEQVEVIYGPGSLIYGSDALGGVVHFRSRDPQLIFDKKSTEDYILETNAYTRFASANYEKSVHLDLDYGGRRWGLLSSLTYSNYGDLQSGQNAHPDYPNFGRRDFYVLRNEVDMVLDNSNPYLQVGTEYSQIDFLQKLKFQPTDYFNLTFNFQYSTSSDVPRYDNLTDTLASADRLKWAEWYYGPQKRLFGSMKIKHMKSNLLYDKMTFIASYQKIDEDRLKRKYTKTHRTFNFEDVHVFSSTVDFAKYLDKKERHQFSYGFEGTYNLVYSVAGQFNIKTGNVKGGELERYPSGSSDMTTLAAYANYRWRNRDSTLALNLGTRYSKVGLYAQYDPSEVAEWPQSYLDGVSVSNQEMTYGAGLTWNSKDKWQFRVMGSTAFRSPNIDDFAKIRAQNGFVTVPNLELNPEHSMNGEVTLAKEIGQITKGSEKDSGVSLKLSGTVFYTQLTDAIVRKNFQLPDGSDEIIIDDEPHKVIANVNAVSADVYGLSANMVLNISNRWKFKSGINFQKGTTRFIDEVEDAVTEEMVSIDTILPFDHIPPMYGQTSLSYENKKIKLEGVVKYNGVKTIEDYSVSSVSVERGQLILDREGTADNLEEGYHILNDNGQVEFTGTPAWMTFNLYSSYRLNSKISVNLAVENIMDVHYRPFASGLSAPGRNFIISIQGKF